MLTHGRWAAIGGLVHGFLDARDSVADPDWCRALGDRGVSTPLALPRQVHGSTVLEVRAPGRVAEADALVTDHRRLAVGVVTADCVPVLLTDGTRHVAAVHAGWRGTAAGVLEQTLAELARRGAAAATVEALIGPAIGGCCYEVGAEVRDAFPPVTAPAWERRGPKYMLDLRLAVTLLLERARVRRTETIGPCTRCDSTFHSYRRDGADAGRQLSFIGWA